jgi:N-acetylmuramoyl-L-alanine amidase
MATVMVECGNMRDPGDVARMTSARGQAAYVKALVAGIRADLAAR